MLNGTGLGLGRGGGGAGGGVKAGFSRPTPLNDVNLPSVSNDGHPIFYLLSLFDEQCSCEWLVQFICQTVNSFFII